LCGRHGRKRMRLEVKPAMWVPRKGGGWAVGPRVPPDVYTGSWCLRPGQASRCQAEDQPERWPPALWQRGKSPPPARPRRGRQNPRSRISAPERGAGFQRPTDAAVVCVGPRPRVNNDRRSPTERLLYSVLARCVDGARAREGARADWYGSGAERPTDVFYAHNVARSAIIRFPFRGGKVCIVAGRRERDDSQSISSQPQTRC